MLATARPHTDTGTLQQLAWIGHDAGIIVTQEAGGYVAQGPTGPGSRHIVTGFTCDCATFITRGACLHHAVLLATLGWLPADAGNRSR